MVRLKRMTFPLEWIHRMQGLKLGSLRSRFRMWGHWGSLGALCGPALSCSKRCSRGRSPRMLRVHGVLGSGSRREPSLSWKHTPHCLQAPEPLAGSGALVSAIRSKQAFELERDRVLSARGLGWQPTQQASGWRVRGEGGDRKELDCAIIDTVDAPH